MMVSKEAVNSFSPESEHKNLENEVSVTTSPVSPTIMLHPSKSYICTVCNKTFATKSNLTRHVKVHSQSIKNFICNDCGKNFSRNGDLQRHRLLHTDKTTNQTTYECKKCHKSFNTLSNKNRHQKRHVLEDLTSVDKNVKRMKKTSDALNSCFTYETLPSETVQFDCILFIEEVRPQLQIELENQIKMKRASKWCGVIECDMTRTDTDGNVFHHTFHLRSTSKTLLRNDQIAEQIEITFAEMLERFESITHLGSGWKLDKVIKFELFIGKYCPFPGRSKSSTSIRLKNKKKPLNILKI